MPTSGFLKSATSVENEVKNRWVEDKVKNRGVGDSLWGGRDGEAMGIRRVSESACCHLVFYKYNDVSLL